MEFTTNSRKTNKKQKTARSAKFVPHNQTAPITSKNRILQNVGSKCQNSFSCTMSDTPTEPQTKPTFNAQNRKVALVTGYCHTFLAKTNPPKLPNVEPMAGSFQTLNACVTRLGTENALSKILI